MFCIFAGFGTQIGSQLGTKSDSNGSLMNPHRLILSEDEATAYTELLEAFPALFRIISGPFSRKIMVLGCLPGFFG